MASNVSKVFSLSLAQGILMIVNISSGIFLSRFLSIEEYAIYLQTFIAYDFAVPILTLGLPTALYYTLPKENINPKGHVINYMALLLFSGLLFSLFLFFGGNKYLAIRFNNQSLLKTLEWMIFYPLYTFPLLIFSSVLVIQNKIKLNSIYNIVTGTLLGLTLIIVSILSTGYTLPLFIRIFLPLLFFPFGCYLIFKNISGKWVYPSFSSIKQIIFFSIPLGLASVLGSLTLQFVGLLVSFLTTPEEYAFFANGAKEVPFIGIVTGSISVIVMNDLAQKINKGEIQESLLLFKKASLISASFLFPIMCFLMVFSESFITILYSEKYLKSVESFRFYLLIMPIRIAYYGSAFIAFGKSKAILKRSIFDLILTSILSYFLFNFFGNNGAILGLLITMYLWTLPFNIYTLSKSFKCDFLDVMPFKQLFKILIIAILSACVSLIVLSFDLRYQIEFLIGFCFYIIIYSIISFFYNYDFKMFIISAFRSKFFNSESI